MTNLNTGAIFVTGTDTGVGKTYVATALTQALCACGRDVGVMKPIETGCEYQDGRLVPSDALALSAAAATSDSIDLVCPMRFATAAAPSTASREEGIAIDLETVLNAYRELRRRHELVIVEGAGGIAVPIRNQYTMANLAVDMQCPLIIVGRASLGTINHTALTVHYARSFGLSVLGAVINSFPAIPSIAEQAAPHEIARLADTPILGVLPFDDNYDQESGLGKGISTSTNARLIANRVIELLLEVPTSP